MLATCLLVAFGSAAAPACARPVEDEVAAALSALRAGSLTERADAEQRLAALLRPSDHARLLAALQPADPEVDARVANALGASDAHVELAARLLVAEPVVAREVGARALRQQIERWLPGAYLMPRRGSRVSDALSDWRSRFLWRPIASPARGGEELELERELDRLARLAPLPVGVALDPDLALAPAPRARTGAPFFGPWDLSLEALARAARVELQAPERWPEWGEPTQPFVVVVAGSSAAPHAPGERLIDWLGMVAGSAPAPRRAAAARALAGSGWPAGIEWLGERWRVQRDAAALDGALVAAGRGAVAHALREAATVDALLAWIDRGPGEVGGAPELDGVFERNGAQPRRHIVERIANALGAGPHQDKDGGNRIERLRGGIASVGPDGLYVRLVAFERLGAVHPEAAADCARLLGAAAAPGSLAADPELHARLLRQALRAVVALGGASVDVADPELLLSNATDPASARELARLLIAGGAGGARRVRAATLSSHGRFALCAWLAGSGDIAGAAEQVTSVDPAEAGAWLRASGLERGTDLAGRVAQAARAALGAQGTLAAAEERIHALELHAGVLPEALEPTVVAAAIRAGELELLARAAAGVAGEAARAALLDQLSGALSLPPGEPAGDPSDAKGTRLERALGLALRELYASSQDARADEFIDAVDERLRAARKHPLAAALVEHGWPRLPPLDWLDLDAADRRR